MVISCYVQHPCDNTPYLPFPIRITSPLTRYRQRTALWKKPPTTPRERTSLDSSKCLSDALMVYSAPHHQSCQVYINRRNWLHVGSIQLSHLSSKFGYFLEMIWCESDKWITNCKQTLKLLTNWTTQPISNRRKNTTTNYLITINTQLKTALINHSINQSVR